jgi:hypothetical protein
LSFACRGIGHETDIEMAQRVNSAVLKKQALHGNKPKSERFNPYLMRRSKKRSSKQGSSKQGGGGYIKKTTHKYKKQIPRKNKVKRRSRKNKNKRHTRKNKNK